MARQVLSHDCLYAIGVLGLTSLLVLTVPGEETLFRIHPAAGPADVDSASHLHREQTRNSIASDPQVNSSAGPVDALDSSAIPKFVNHLYINLYKVSRISRFRSSQGHDYSDDFERCRSMKHYFAFPGPDTELYAPVDGTITKLDTERSGIGMQVAIQSSLYPEFSFIIFHVSMSPSLSLGSKVSAGERIGNHASQFTNSDIAVQIVDAQGQRRFVSFFDTLTDAAVDEVRSHGVASIESLTISREARDAQPLGCAGDESFTTPDPVTPQWIDLAAFTPPRLTIHTLMSDLPVGQSNQTYAASLTASGGTAPYNWTVSFSSLPAGLGLDAASGRISGTPSQAGDFFFTVRVSDATGSAITRDLRINISASSPLADLGIFNMTAPTQSTPGRAIEVSAVIKNFASAVAGPFKIRFYLSPDSTVTAADIDAQFGCTLGAGLPAKGSFNCTGLATLPGSLAVGTYYLGVLVDPEDSVTEANEINNGRISDSGPLQITAAEAPVSTSLFVPIVLSSAGLKNSFFTSELVLTNRGPNSTSLAFSYVEAFGGGSGTGSDTLGPGKQVIVPDAITYLRSRGVPLPDSGNRGGTLIVRFDGLNSASDAGVTVRTTTAVSNGRAGLAYPGLSTAALFNEPVYLCGLRQNAASDRSNLAVQHAGTDSSGEITLQITVFDGNSSFSKVLAPVTLLPGGFFQISGILQSNGMNLSQGYVRVEKLGGSSPYFAYAVVNDQANSDGSFIPPVPESALAGRQGLILPVMVETAAFASELVVTNWSGRARKIRFDFRAEAIATPDHLATFTLDLPAGRQYVFPDVVQAIRKAGIPGMGLTGPTFAGALFAAIEGEDVIGLFIGARTSTAGGGGRYGLFYPAVPHGKSSTPSAWLYGLQQNVENRTNLAIVNTGEVDASDSVFRIDLYDGDTGVKVDRVTVTVSARNWTQIGSILAPHGIQQGYAEVRRISGINPFLTYSVVNDGAQPNQRSGDGAFVTSTP